MGSAKQSLRGRKQDRAKVAARQDYELQYESQKTSRSKRRSSKRSKASVTVAGGSNEFSRAKEVNDGPLGARNRGAGHLAGRFPLWLSRETRWEGLCTWLTAEARLPRPSAARSI